MESEARAQAPTLDPAQPRRPTRVGRYLLFPAFARGGMASVHVGRLLDTPGFTRLVAVKRLHPLFAESQKHYRMLLEEARITSRIRHANVVPLLDVIRDGGELCLVMDYVSGVSLSDLVREARETGERIPPAIASAIIGDVLRGLHAAHEARAEDGTPLEIVHRDVSPHNVLIGTDGVARVLDFGIAKALHAEHRTVSGELKGKLAYMAPEQLRGQRATRQSDIYAAGVVLWETLTGEPLHEPDGIDLGRLLAGASSVTAPSTRAPTVTPALDAVVVRALALEARDRFETAEEMAIALTDATAPAAPEQVADLLVRVADAELSRRAEYVREAEIAPGPGVAEEPIADRGADKPRPRSRIGFIATALLAVAAVVGGAWALAREPRPPAGPSPSASPPSAVPTGGQPAAAVATATGEQPAAAVAAPTPPSAVPTVGQPAAAVALPSARPRRTTSECVPPFVIDDAGVKRYKRECI